MSNNTFYVRETENIPYNNYIEFFSCNKCSLSQYVSLVIDNYKFAEKEKAHRIFYNTLVEIKDNHYIPQEIRNVAQNLIKSKKVSIFGIINLL